MKGLIRLKGIDVSMKLFKENKRELVYKFS